MHSDSDTLESYDAKTDDSSRTTEVARDHVDELAETRDISIGKFVEDVCDNLDKLKYQVFGSQKNRQWGRRIYQGGSEGSLSTMSGTRTPLLNDRKKEVFFLPSVFFCGA